MPDKPPSSAPDTTARLEGWEAIAYHLGVHKRTARAWHTERGLPVHQLFGKGGRVFAIPAELDEWRVRSDKAAAVEPVAREAPRWRKPAIRVALVAALAASLILGREVFTARHPPVPPPGRLLAKLTSETGHLNLIPLTEDPCNEVVTPDGAQLLISNCNGGTLSVISTAAGKVVRTLAAGDRPQALALARDGRRLYIGNLWGGIRIFDVARGEITGEIAIEGPVHDMVAAPDGTLYVARRERGLAAVRPSDGRITPIPVTALPVYLAIDDDGTHLYVSYQGGGPGGRLGHDAIDVYDTKRGAFTGSIAGPPRVGGRMAVSRSGVLLADGEDACWSGGYRSAQADCPAVPGSVFSLIRTSDNRLLATLGYPGSVDAWIGASPDGTRLATGSYTLRVVDISSMHVLEAYRIPEVRRVLFAPDGRRAWVVLGSPHAIAALDTDGGSCAAAPAGLAGWWPGDGTADDAIGPNNGELAGSAGYAPGLAGQAFRLDGAGYVSLGGLDAVQAGSPEYTVMAWVKFSGSGSEEEAVLDRSGPAGGFRISRAADGRMRFVAGRKGSTPVVALSGAVVPADRWVHLAAERRADSISLWIDGKPVATERLAGVGWRGAESGEVRVGALGDGAARMRGLVDEVQWYTRALGANEVQRVVAARGAGVCLR